MEPKKLNQLLRYLGRSEEWHYKELFENGMWYLENYLKSTPELIPLYSYQKAYWTWYSRQYHRRCEMLLIYFKKHNTGTAEARERYANRLSIKPTEIFPNRAVEQIIMKRA